MDIRVLHDREEGKSTLYSNEFNLAFGPVRNVSKEVMQGFAEYIIKEKT